MPKGRIGLSLDEDVLAILNKYGRTEVTGHSLETAKAIWRGMLNNSNSTGERIEAQMILENLERPTRTEITQTAIREWAARQEK